MKSQTNLSNELIVQKSFLFEKALYLFRSILIPENSPFAIAVGVLVFLQRQDDFFLNTLYKHLDNEMLYLSSDPQDQSDLENSLIKLLAYHGLCQKKGYRENIPPDLLGTYLQYAEKEEWLGSTTLAIFANLFASDMQATVSIFSNFSSNVKSQIAQGHLGNIFQMTMLINGALADTEKSILLQRIRNEQISSHDYPWIILALNAMLSDTHHSQLTSEIMYLMNDFVGKYLSHFEELIAKNRDGLILEGIINSSRLQKQIDLDLTQENTIIEKVEFKERDFVVTLKDNPLPSIFSTELGLFLWVLTTTGNDQIVGFRGGLEDIVRQTIDSQQKISKSESILVDKNVMLLLNLLALLLIVGIGVGIFLYYGGASLDLSKLDLFNAPTLIAAALTLVILLFGIFSLIKTGNIISLLLEIDSIKKVFNQIKEMNKKG